MVSIPELVVSMVVFGFWSEHSKHSSNLKKYCCSIFVLEVLAPNDWICVPSEMLSLPVGGATEHVWLVVGSPAVDARFAMVAHQGMLGL